MNHPGVLGSIPKREDPGKPGAPCVKVPGSSRVPDGQTHPHRPRLVVSHSTCPPLSSSPHAHSFVIGPAVIKHTHPMCGNSPLFELLFGLAYFRNFSVGTICLPQCLLLKWGVENYSGEHIYSRTSSARSLALPFFSPSFFHTISLSPAFISARWAD